jgi:hypothetical protein
LLHFQRIGPAAIKSRSNELKSFRARLVACKQSNQALGSQEAVDWIPGLHPKCGPHARVSTLYTGPGDISESNVSTEPPSSLAPMSQKRSTPARAAATTEMARAPARRRKKGAGGFCHLPPRSPLYFYPSSHHLVRNRHFPSLSSLLPHARKVSRRCWRRRRRLRLRPLLRQGFTSVHLQP